MAGSLEIIAILVSVFTAVCSLGQNQVNRVVQTKYGPVRGYLDAEGGVFNFHGIPYATTPTGNNRFKPPLPPPVRLYILDAVETQIACPQPYKAYYQTDKLKLQEDCLVLNLFVPDSNKTNLSVYVHIHGGAFRGGYGNLWTLKGLARSNKVIAITFNYRLGPQGFLCLGTKDIPGNAGFKDQIALLKWVKENIANFGGNPNDVTIGGDSAGSASVDLLMLSKKTEGLFHKVVPQSGPGTAVWVFQSDPIEYAKKYAKTLNFTNVDDILAVENFYKTAPIELLIPHGSSAFHDCTFEFGACIEKSSDEMFLDNNPAAIIASGMYKKVPILYGIDDFEASLIRDYKTWKDEMNNRFSDFLPGDLQFNNEKQKEDIARRVKQFYFGNLSVGDKTYLKFFQYFGDIMFVYPLLRAVKLHKEAGHDQIYLYEYTYPKEHVVSDSNGLTVFAANHTSQTDAFRDEPLAMISEEYLQVKAYMREIIVNFITTGVPVPPGSPLPPWPPVNSVKLTPHMILNATAQLQGPMHADIFQFWDDIYDKHYRPPVPPNIV